MKCSRMLITAVFIAATMTAGAVDVLVADFQGSTTQDNTDIANINLGASVGSFENPPPGQAYIKESNTEKVLFLDRRSGAGIDFKGHLSETIDVDGAVFELDTVIRRTTSTPAVKDIFFVGLDGSGNKSFEIALTGDNDSGPAGSQHRLFYVDPVGGYTVIPEGADGDGLPTQNSTYDSTVGMNHITVTCSADGYIVSFVRDTTSWTTAAKLPYSGTATTIATIGFIGSDETGYYMDNVHLSGTASAGGDGDGDGDGDGGGGSAGTPEAGMPVASAVGLGLLGCAIALGGISLSRKKK